MNIPIAVVTCDLKTIPSIPHANHIISRQQPTRNGLLLPGGVHITYTCVTGYTTGRQSNMVQCVYYTKPRENDTDNELVTAIWKGQKDIRCVKGLYHGLLLCT